MEMKIVFISDTHTAHRDLELPEGDVLVFAGDMCISHTGADTIQLMEQVRDFNEWLGELDFERKICISGNHEKVFQKCLVNNLSNAVYLEDQMYKYKGVIFYGSPWTPHFYGAFNASEESLALKYKRIEDSVDVLITHGPPFGILDSPNKGDHAGSASLRVAVDRIKPKVHVFGHIHAAYGEHNRDGIQYFNASMAGRKHTDMANKPWVFEV
jgi:Icc-related predicted phosphoesterase